MQTFVERLENERDELEQRMANLAIFTKSDKFNNLDNINKTLLIIQYDAMKTYCSILESRLDLLS